MTFGSWIFESPARTKARVSFVVQEAEGDVIYQFDNPQRDHPIGEVDSLFVHGHSVFDNPDGDLHVTFNSGRMQEDGNSHGATFETASARACQAAT